MENSEQIEDLVSEEISNNESNNKKVNKINDNAHNDTKKYKCGHEGTKHTKKIYEKKRHCCVPFCDSYLTKGLFTFPKDDSLKQGP